MCGHQIRYFTTVRQPHSLSLSLHWSERTHPPRRVTGYRIKHVACARESADPMNAVITTLTAYCASFSHNDYPVPTT